MEAVFVPGNPCVLRRQISHVIKNLISSHLILILYNLTSSQFSSSLIPFRFCPSVFFYLATIVPCVWILELDMLSDRLNAKATFDHSIGAVQKQIENITLFQGVSMYKGMYTQDLFDECSVRCRLSVKMSASKPHVCDHIS